MIVEPGVKTGVPVLHGQPQGGRRRPHHERARRRPPLRRPVRSSSTSAPRPPSTRCPRKGEYVGGAIAPGIEISVDALAVRGRPAAQGRAGPAAQRHRQEHRRGAAVRHHLRLRRARSTASSSGWPRSWPTDPDDGHRHRHRRPGAAGRSARSRVIDVHEPWLTLIGLRLVYERNVGRRDPAARTAGRLANRLPGVAGAPTGTASEPTYRDRTLPEQMRVRLEKLERLRAERHRAVPGRTSRGRTPSPRSGRSTPTWNPGHRDRRDASASPAGSCSTAIGGKLCFATLRDGTGDIQVMISLDRVGEEALAAWKRDVDLGDHVGVEGEVITSRRGELSVLADRWAITSKCLRPLPEKHTGPDRPRGPGPPALRRPDRQRRGPADGALRSDAVRAVRDSWHERGLPRGRDADAAADPRRRDGPAVQDPHQRLRHGALPAHRARALPQAAGGRRHREGLRDQPQLPQRGRGLHAQPRVHDARGVRAPTATTTTWPT